VECRVESSVQGASGWVCDVGKCRYAGDGSVILGVEEVAQAVARQVEREGEGEDGEAWPPC